MLVLLKSFKISGAQRWLIFAHNYSLGITGTQPNSFIYILSMAASKLQWQSWVVATETIWPMRLKYLLSCSSHEKFADLSSGCLGYSHKGWQRRHSVLLTFANVRGEKFRKRIKWWWKMGNQRGQLFVCSCIYFFLLSGHAMRSVGS